MVFLLTRNGSVKGKKMEDGSVPTKNGSGGGGEGS